MTAPSKKESSEAGRRKYNRLDTVLPVEFRILSQEGKTPLSDWLQGFTNNISKGGICLTVNNLKPDLAKIIKDKQAKLSLNIEIPFAAAPVPASARVAWVQDVTSQPDKYLIGLSYEEIASSGNRRIMRFVIARRLFVPVVSVTIAILAIGFIIGSYINVKLIKSNKAMVEQLVRILQESSVAKQTVKALTKEKEDLGLVMETLELRIKTAEEKNTALQGKIRESDRGELNAMIQKLMQDKAALQKALNAVQHKENTLTEDLLRLDKKKSTLEKANLDNMYQWLKIRQNPRTGLVLSFEGDGDMANRAFIYDQALVSQAFAYFFDFERAKEILNFFDSRAEKRNGLFYNVYYANTGDAAENIVYSGPNIWLGIAALQYTKRSQDLSYLKLAEEIAEGIIGLQDQEGEGGIRGGPDVEWYIVEHNLDAYAFFNMLYRVTFKNKYLAARDKVLNWLLRHAQDKSDPSIKRGKGDSTVATDTYAWSIAAVGPEKLEEMGMNPDMILEAAEKKCRVEVSYARPGGTTVKIKGFDFAPEKRLATGGVVSSEWTAQMVISFKIMADFYYKKDMIAKARSYELKADDYLAGLGNMIIPSPSPSGQGKSCLPYATQDSVDTGHGWTTPEGKVTGSLPGTTYTLFAYYSYNPLELK